MSEPHANAQSSFTTAALAVLGAIGTGIGVLGFLTFVGGATWIARFRGLELSGTYAISVAPRSELIATGADQLLDPAVVALGAATVALAALLLARWLRLGTAEWTGVAVVLVLLGAAGLGWYFHDRVGTLVDGDVRELFAGAAITVALGGGIAVLLARRAYAPGEPPSAARAAALASAVALTVLVYGAFETYALNLVRPHVRGAAVVEPDGRGVAGWYVGQDADTIFLGMRDPPLAHMRSERSNVRIVQVPLTDASRIAVGSTLSPDGAYRMAEDLLADLRAQPAS